MTLQEFNLLTPVEAEAKVLDCCGSARWAGLIASQRPFHTTNSFFSTADAMWRKMERADILEAFSHHPQIGQKADTGSVSHRRWSEGEQTGAKAATDDVKTRLAAGNRAYFEKFGYIYIVCATGKSAEEMLAILDQRLQNSAADELPIAAEQQRLIMQVRLKKLFGNA